jgi:3-dehydroquinate dehydratase/shikimate dehydrogenase
MLVTVPISAGDVESLLALGRQAEAQGADLVEVRLDTCAKLGADTAALAAAIPRLALPAVATVRHAAEGGDWRGDEESRLRLLCAADLAGAAYVDIELRFVAGLPAAGLRAKRIVSYHDFEGMGDDLDGRIRAMRAAGADVAKVAVRPRDAADLAVIAALYRDHAQGGPLAAIAMGEHGLPSRLLAGVWGAHLAFARLDGDHGSAPGQPTARELVELYRIRHQSARTRVFGVIGSPVAHSLSPLIHNTAFIHHQLDAVYVPFRVEDAPAFWRACGEWIAGLSITIPHKQALIPLMHGIEDLAARIGAMNTVYRDKDLRPVGANTDALAVIRCLEGETGCLAGRRVLVLGAGGVSRAIAFAVAERGGKVAIANRTFDRAQELAAETGAEAVELERATTLPFDVLVNGTALGMGKPDETPWPAEAHRKESVVFDTVYHPLETRLLKDAQRAGARTVCGLDMLISQALGQFKRWTGLEAPEHLMYRAALERIGGTRTG